MIWLLLFALTLLAVLLPMLPAIVEWWRPTDVVPLHIDTADALDPPYLARSFAARLFTAVSTGQKLLGKSEIAAVPDEGDWPLRKAEERDQATRRVWHSAGDAELPDGINFLGEVAAAGYLGTVPGGVYRALWAGQQMRLAPDSTVLRWAHGARIDVGAGCRLAGRVSAEECITFEGDTGFELLHAPLIRFSPDAVMPPATAAAPTGRASVRGAAAGLPASVVWNAAATRATCDESVDMGSHRVWRGDVVGRGDLTLGPGCLADGSLKARGDLVIAAGCAVVGSMVAEGRIEVGERCTVWGSVVSETAIVLEPGCVVGAPDHPATVAAPVIEVGPGVVVHGTLWAGESGRAFVDAAAPRPALVPGARPADPDREAPSPLHGVAA